MSATQERQTFEVRAGTDRAYHAGHGLLDTRRHRRLCKLSLHLRPSRLGLSGWPWVTAVVCGCRVPMWSLEHLEPRVLPSQNGFVPAVCKSAGIAYVGSNPTPATSRKSSLTRGFSAASPCCTVRKGSRSTSAQRLALLTAPELQSPLTRGNSGVGSSERSWVTVPFPGCALFGPATRRGEQAFAQRSCPVCVAAQDLVVVFRECCAACTVAGDSHARARCGTHQRGARGCAVRVDGGRFGCGDRVSELPRRRVRRPPGAAIALTPKKSTPVSELSLRGQSRARRWWSRKSGPCI